MTDMLCVYCQQRVADTEDHIPGRQFFADPKPPPSELIAVPACRKCNDQFSKIEDYVCSHLLFGQGGVSVAGKAIWQQRMHRTYQKNDGLRRLISRSLHPLNIFTPEGLYAGQRLALDTDFGRVSQFIVKLVKGLYYFEFDEPLPLDVVIDFPEYHAEHVDLSEPHSLTRRGKRSWPGTFEYKCERVPDAHTESAWMFRFYGENVFVAFTSKYENPEDAEQAESTVRSKAAPSASPDVR